MLRIFLRLIECHKNAKKHVKLIPLVKVKFDREMFVCIQDSGKRQWYWPHKKQISKHDNRVVHGICTCRKQIDVLNIKQ